MPDSNAIRNVTLWGLAINILLSVLKAAVGILYHSGASFADAVHSFSDSITDLAIIFGVKYWSEPADENHPHGHQRIEALITLFIGLMLGFISMQLIEKAFSTIGNPLSPTPGWPVAIIAIFSIISKEILFHWTRHVGQQQHSAATVANAWHHRSDAFSSIPVAVSAILMKMFPEDLPYLDPVATVIVSLMLFKAACGIAWPAIQELADSGASASIRQQLLDMIKQVKGVRDAHHLRTRRIGDAFTVDVHILVDANLSVKQGHDICTEVSRQLTRGKTIKILDVLTHLEPWDNHERLHP